MKNALLARSSLLTVALILPHQANGASERAAIPCTIVRGWTSLAEADDPGAQYELGMMYLRGFCVWMDREKAETWFQKAAANGNQSARRADRILASDHDLVPSEIRAWGWEPSLPPIGPGSSQWEENEEARAFAIDPLRKTRLVVSIQRHLLMMGYDVGNADGTLGSKTDAAIREYQATHLLEVDGQPTSKLERHIVRTRTAQAAGARAVSGDAPARKLVGSGSGFVVSQAGHALTSYHVVERCGSITAVDHNAVRIQASLESSDRISDLAVIKLDAAASSVATFAPKGSIQRGAQVIVVGFPLQGVLASQANVTAGTISATAGIRGDARWFQITAPVQPGNSGGPVLDEWGRVIGLVVASLDVQTIFEIFGDIPENVNFAIGADLLRVFLRASSIQYSAGKGLGHTSSVARIGREAAEFTVFVECWR